MDVNLKVYEYFASVTELYKYLRKQVYNNYCLPVCVSIYITIWEKIFYT